MPSASRMTRGVMRKEEADNVAVSYNPKKFPAVVAPTAAEFHAFNAAQGESSGFRIDRLVAEQTGIAEIERLSIEEKVEREALVRLKELQEQAYREAYQLGLEEGREKAFVERKNDLVAKIAALDELLVSMENLKADLAAFNETQIVRLVFFMAKRIVGDEISAKPELILKCVQQAIASAQSDEHVTLRVSPEDFAFIESVKEKLGKEFDGIKRAKIESAEEIASGGCIVETNYGDVNATLEQRLGALWTAISEKLPKIKNVVGG